MGRGDPVEGLAECGPEFRHGAEESAAEGGLHPGERLFDRVEVGVWQR
jgi:hypothetical protein